MATATNSTSLFKIDRADVMRAAWKRYNRHRFLIPGQRRPFDPKEFAYRLRCAWADAKQAMMTVQERRVIAIETELEMLRYKPLSVNIATREVALRAELASIAI